MLFSATTFTLEYDNVSVFPITIKISFSHGCIATGIWCQNGYFYFKKAFTVMTNAFLMCAC